MLSDKIRLLLKEVGINLTFSVSAFRSFEAFASTRFGAKPICKICNLLTRKGAETSYTEIASFSSQAYFGKERIAVVQK